MIIDKHKNHVKKTMDDLFFEDQFSCPVCGSEAVVPPIGRPSSKILIVGEFPGKEEIKHGKPMVGAMGGVFRTELAMLGFDITQARRTNIWKHPKNKNRECLEDGAKDVAKEAKGKDAILFLGDEGLKYFFGEDAKVTKLAGMRLESDLFSADLIMCCVNPAWVFKRGNGVGEMRFALRRFIEELGVQGWE